MIKKFVLVLAVLAISFAGASFAAVESIKVSGDINTEAVSRYLGLGLTDDNNEDFLFSQIRLRFDADLTEGVSAVVSLINERIWGEETADATNGGSELALDLACIELKEFFDDSLTLVVGRQNLRFGNALILGDPDTNQYASVSVPIGLRDLSLRKSFDAVTAIIDLAPWTIDLVFAKVEENAVLDRNDDVTITGLNIAYDWNSRNGVTEAYFFNVNNSPAVTAGATATSTADSEDKIYVVGGRTQADLNDKLTLGAEGAYQFGDRRMTTVPVSHREVSAFAIQALAEYKLLDAKNTKLAANYTYLSGDSGKGTNESTFDGWNPLFEDQSPGEVINILFSNTNLQYLKLSASTMPQEDVTVGLDYVYAALAQGNTAARLSGAGTSANNQYGATGPLLVLSEREIGHEVDFYGVYDYTEDVQFKVSGGWLIPGSLFLDSNNDIAYSLRAGMNVSF